jgi:hypothetical protein
MANKKGRPKVPAIRKETEILRFFVTKSEDLMIRELSPRLIARGKPNRNIPCVALPSFLGESRILLMSREIVGGREGIRTLGLLVANEALSQLSYSPTSHREL